MNDSTASDAHDGDRASHSATDLTAPLPAGGTVDHVSLPVNAGTLDFPTNALGTLDQVPSIKDGTEVSGGGTVDHAPSAGDATEAIGGTVDHVPTAP
jgi:hypothetical protein